MRMDRPLKSSIVSGIGVVVCAWTAALLCLLLRGRHVGALVPMVFLLIVAMVAIRCGAVAGVLGSSVAALIFAVFLYRPLGTPLVSDSAARMNVGWVLLGGIACSYLLGSGKDPQQNH